VPAGFFVCGPPWSKEEGGDMTIQKTLQRKVDLNPVFFGFGDLIETGGIAFPDGRCIELVKDDLGSLTFFDSKSEKFHKQIVIGDQEFVPPKLPDFVAEALSVPTKRTDCGSTVEMFAQICNLFLGYGFSEETAQLSTFFALASWFPENLPLAPCLIITGSEAEAQMFFQLLMCVVRHAFPLMEVNLGIFEYFPMHLQPTLLISYVDPPMWRLLSASNYPNAYFSNKKFFTDLYCIKAVYAGATSGRVYGDAFLNVDCNLSCEKFTVVKGAVLKKMAANLQSKLLDYRLKHVAQVRDANFDATTLPIPLRMLAQTLGSCIVDAPELLADIVRLLESKADELCANRMLDPQCVVIEAMFAHCHGENGPTRVGVNEIATTATTIMAGRGENEVLEFKRTGNLLKHLGFRAKRDSKGFAIHLTAEVRRLIHRLAHDHEVADSEQAVPGCSHCTDVLSSRPGKLNS
jgi:hypothetical protein